MIVMTLVDNNGGVMIYHILTMITKKSSLL